MITENYLKLNLSFFLVIIILLIKLISWDKSMLGCWYNSETLGPEIAISSTDNTLPLKTAEAAEIKIEFVGAESDFRSSYYFFHKDSCYVDYGNEVLYIPDRNYQTNTTLYLFGSGIKSFSQPMISTQYRYSNLPQEKIKISYWVTDVKNFDLDSFVWESHQYANMIMEQNGVGISITADSIGKVTNVPDIASVKFLAKHIFNARIQGITTRMSELRQSNLFFDNEINVYFLDFPKSNHLDRKGFYSSKAPQIILMNQENRDYSTLLHELGHAMALSQDEIHPKILAPGCPDQCNCVSPYNIMITGAYSGNRDQISIGQSYRMNYNENSIFNLLQRSATGIRCKDQTNCPCPCLNQPR